MIPDDLTPVYARWALGEVRGVTAKVAASAEIPWWLTATVCGIPFGLLVMAYLPGGPGFLGLLLIAPFVLIPWFLSIWEQELGLFPRLPLGRTGLLVNVGLSVLMLLVFVVLGMGSATDELPELGLQGGVVAALCPAAMLWFREQRRKRYLAEGALPSTEWVTSSWDGQFASPVRVRLAAVLCTVNVVELGKLTELIDSGAADTPSLAPDLEYLKSISYLDVSRRRSRLAPSFGGRLWVGFTRKGREAFKRDVAALELIASAG